MTKKLKPSSFEDWFTAQFGKRPSGHTIRELRAHVENCRGMFVNAERVLFITERWEDQRDAALKGWCAK